MVSDQPLPQVTDEGQRVAEAAEAEGVTLKLTGGVGIALTCASAARPPFARGYSDIDVVGHAKERRSVIDLMQALGYVADEAFNAMHGARRLYFWDVTHQRQFDVFLDKVEMCHVIDLRDRLGGPGPTLTAADLLLMKLQVVEANDKDLRDIVCLLTDKEFTSGSDAGIDLAYIAELAARDWGLWRTITMIAGRAAKWAGDLPTLDSLDRVRHRIGDLVRALEAEPKSRAWKLRARVGDRKQWYLLPEEAH